MRDQPPLLQLECQRRLLGFVDARLQSMLHDPALWGGTALLERQVLLLLEARATALGAELGELTWLREGWLEHLREWFPGSPTSLTEVLERRDDLESMPRYLGAFLVWALQRMNGSTPLPWPQLDQPWQDGGHYRWEQ